MNLLSQLEFTQSLFEWEKQQSRVIHSLEGLNDDDENYFDIQPILEREMGGLKINERLVKDIEWWLNSYIHRNEEQTNFFGGNLTGVNRIVFTNDDRNSLAIDLFDVDESQIKRDVRRLPHIGDNWVRATDGLNLSLVYLCHRIHNNDTLKPQIKTKAIVLLLIILQCKFLSSLLYAYFKYPVSEKLATAVYEALSKKFYIKKYGTWYGILEARALDIYSPESPHYDTIVNFGPDKKIVYIITDTQTRIKSMILNIYEVTMRLHQKGIGIGSVAAMRVGEDKIEVRDVEKHFDNYLNYINKTIQEPRAFIKPELITIISDSITTMPEKLLYDVLNVISVQSQQNDRVLDEHIRDILIYMFDYFRTNRRDIKDLNNLGNLVITFKSLFTASKTNSTTVLKLRDYFDTLVKKNIKSSNPQTIAGVRTGIILYVVLRTLTMNHYG